MTTVAEMARRDLAPEFEGQLLSPEDEGYQDARKISDGLICGRPALFAHPAGVDDVLRAARFARRAGLAVTVHGVGLGKVDDCLVIDLSYEKGIAVNPHIGTVRVGGGATWNEVDRATQPLGLAVPAAMNSTTGIAGLTLAGGIGHLLRPYGPTTDSLLEATIVLADGQFVMASKDESPDLFRSFCGNGEASGVATSFLFQARPLSSGLASE